MKRGTLFVRAITFGGSWGKVDVIDLDDESFRAFVLDTLVQLTRELGAGIASGDGPDIEYRARGVKTGDAADLVAMYRTMHGLDLVKLRHAFISDRTAGADSVFCNLRITAIDTVLKERERANKEA